MEDRIQRLSGQTLVLASIDVVPRLLVAAIALACSLTFTPAASAATADDLELDPLVVREPERREVKIDRLDTENFELGAFGGVLSVEDFGSDVVYGVRAAYHITEDFFLEGTYASSTLGQTSFEQLSGGAELLTDEERDFSYYNLGIGINIPVSYTHLTLPTKA